MCLSMQIFLLLHSKVVKYVFIFNWTIGPNGKGGGKKKNLWSIVNIFQSSQILLWLKLHIGYLFCFTL